MVVQISEILEILETAMFFLGVGGYTFSDALEFLEIAVLVGTPIP